MADSGYESKNIQTIILEKGDTGYGFNIRGGIDNCHVGDDPGIFVSSMRPDGSAAKDERLKKGDKVLSINGQSLAHVAHQVAVDAFRKATEKVVLVVESGAEARIKSELEQKEQFQYNHPASGSKHPPSSTTVTSGPILQPQQHQIMYAGVFVFGAALLAGVYISFRRGWFQSVWQRLFHRS